MEQERRAVETVDQAIHRLAAVATVRGVRVYVYPPTGEHYATSASTPGLLHRVTLLSCDCPGFVRHGRCTHHAALLAELDQLPPLPEPPTPEPMTAQAARHIEHQARAWLESLIARQERGKTIP